MSQFADILKEIWEKQMGLPFFFFFYQHILIFLRTKKIIGIEEGGVQVPFYMYKKNFGLNSYLLCDKLLMFSKIWGKKKTSE